MELISNTVMITEWIRQPWHWAFSGAAIASVLFLMLWMGRSFGVSSSFKGICAVAGAGKRIPYFRIDIKEEFWRFAFVIGALIGGWIAATFLSSPEAVAISSETVLSLENQGYSYPAMDATGAGFVPTALINFTSVKGVLLALGGGFLVGFGARYGGGCTSGHAITGLSFLQLPSLVTVIGFFIGGLLMSHLILPFLM